MSEARRRTGQGSGTPSTSTVLGSSPGGRTGMTWPPALPFASVLGGARTLNARAISLLYHRFLPVVYRFILARVGDIHLAEDLTSETFFAMLEGIAGTRAEDELGFAAWILGIARNRIAMHYRRQRARPETTLDLDLDAFDEATLHATHATHAAQAATGDEGDPLAILTARESWQEVVAALAQLTEDQRTVVLYRCVLGYSADEVGQLMSKQAGTVRALQFRALASLARLLGGQSGQSGADGRPVGNRQEGSTGHAGRR